MKYVGVDLHKNQFSVYWKTEEGKGIFKKNPMKKKGIEEFKKNLDKDTEVVVEAMGNSRFFYNSIVS